MKTRHKLGEKRENSVQNMTKGLYPEHKTQSLIVKKT